MAFKVRGEIRGLKELVGKLDGLKRGLKNKYLRPAMRKATSTVNKAAKANLITGPGATGQLKRSLGAKVKVYPSGVVVGIVEPRDGFRVPQVHVGLLRRNLASRIGGGGGRLVTFHDPRRVAHLLERGTGPRRKRGGASSGVMPARPFLGPAFAANESRIFGIFEAAVEEALAAL